jgi:hypothetical protein
MDRRGWCRAAVAAFLELDELRAWEIEGLRAPVFLELAGGERVLLVLRAMESEEDAEAGASEDAGGGADEAPGDDLDDPPSPFMIEIMVGEDALACYELRSLAWSSKRRMPPEWQSRRIGLSWEHAENMMPEQRLIASEAGQQGDWRVELISQNARDEGEEVADLDLELVTRCLRSVLRAHGRALVAKAAARAGEGDDTLLLQVSGDAMKPKVRASYVPQASWAQELRGIPLPEDAAQWPRHEGTLEIGLFPVLAFSMREAEDLRGIAVRPKGDSESARCEVFDGLDFELAAKRLFELLRTPSKEDAPELYGLWQRVEICSPGLHARLHAGFEALGVECALVEPSDEMLDWGASFSLMLHRGEAEAPELLPELEDAPSWSNLSRLVSGHIQEVIEASDFDVPQEWERFYGVAPDEDAWDQKSAAQPDPGANAARVALSAAASAGAGAELRRARAGSWAGLRAAFADRGDARIADFALRVSEKLSDAEFMAEDTASGELVRFVHMGLAGTFEPGTLLLLRRFEPRGVPLCSMLALPLLETSLEDLRGILREEFRDRPDAGVAVEAEAKLGRVSRRILDLLAAY